MRVGLGHLGRSRGDLDFEGSPTIDADAGETLGTSKRLEEPGEPAGGVPFTLRNYSQFIIQCQIIAA